MLASCGRTGLSTDPNPEGFLVVWAVWEWEGVSGCGCVALGCIATSVFQGAICVDDRGKQVSELDHWLLR